MASSAIRFDPRTGLRRALHQLPAYEALEDPDAIAVEYGIDPASLLKLDGNENPYGPSPKTREALRGEYAAHRYSDAEQRRLRAALAARYGVDAGSVIAGAGSDELIDLIFRIFVEEGDRIVVASPTFGMYAFDALLHGAETVDVPRDDRWEIDAGALFEAARGAKAVFIPSPNNPTGNLMPRSLIEPLLESGALIVIDEAYIEFADAESLAVRAANEPALVVMRTLSKWGGLAGMRVGAAITAPETIEVLLRTKQPYNLSVAAEVAALAALDDAPLLDEQAATLVAERDRVAAAVREFGWIDPWPSDASFLLCRLTGTDGFSLREALRRRGILTRYFDTDRLRDHLRFSMGTPEQNDRLIEAIRDCGTELGVAR